MGKLKYEGNYNAVTTVQPRKHHGILYPLHFFPSPFFT